MNQLSTQRKSGKAVFAALALIIGLSTAQLANQSYGAAEKQPTATTYATTMVFDQEYQFESLTLGDMPGADGYLGSAIVRLKDQDALLYVDVLQNQNDIELGQITYVKNGVPTQEFSIEPELMTRIVSAIESSRGV